MQQTSGRVRPRSFEVEAPRTGAGVRVASGKRDERERRISEARRRRQLRVALVLAVIVLVVGGTTALYRSSLFDIRTVEVVGAERLTQDTVRALAKVPEGATLLRYPGKAIKQRLLDYAWIQDATVTRDFPHALRLHITERKPAAAVDTGKVFWVVDATGMVLGEQSLEETSALITIRDIPGLDLKAGRASTSEILGNALRVLTGIGSELRGKVRAVSAPSIDETTLLTNDNVEIIIGEATELAKKEFIVLDILRKKSGSVVSIDVRSTERPVSRGLGE